MSLRSHVSTRIGTLTALVATIAAGFALLGTPQAQAHHDQQGRIGSWWFMHSSCEPNFQILAHPPLMFADGGRQWVAFQTTLQRQTATGWQSIQVAPIKYQWAGSDPMVGVYQWVDQYNRPVYATHRFYLPNTGNQVVRYRLVARMWWLKDDYHTGGTISDVMPVHDNRPGAGLTQKTYDYCKVPGANELSWIG
jgi:hypothetical protein